MSAGDLGAAAHLIFQWGWGRGLLLIIFQEKRFVSTLGGFFKSVNRILKIRWLPKKKTSGLERPCLAPLLALLSLSSCEISPGSGEGEGRSGGRRGGLRQSWLSNLPVTLKECVLARVARDASPGLGLALWEPLLFSPRGQQVLSTGRGPERRGGLWFSSP